MSFLKRIVSRGLILLFVVFILGVGRASAQKPTTKALRHPTPVPDGFLESMGAQAKFGRQNKLPASLNLSDPHIISVSHFNSSFLFQGTVFPFTMVGANPLSGRATNINSFITPIVMVFPDFVDQNGNPIVLDPTGIVSRTATSPIWQDSTFSSGFTQYADAIQRATFFPIVAQSGWHVLLNPPTVNPPIFVEVPGDDANLFITPNGTIFAVVDTEFFDSQLNTIFQLQRLQSTSIPIWLTTNTFLGANALIQNCCIIGFHGAFESAQTSSAIQLQTFIWASWIGRGIFTVPTIADVHALSHEVAETFNDPFLSNVVPPWLNPESGTCSNLLEVGDPLVGDSIPVMLSGFVYHPQSVALLQWFSRQVPSQAIDGAYSYPDTTAFTSPAALCTPSASAIK